MPRQAALESVARRLIEARRGGPTIQPSAESDAPQSAEEAYRIQELVLAELGHSVGGWKTGGKAAPFVRAPIYSHMIFDAPAKLTGDDFRLIGVELEIAFRFIADPPAGDDPDLREKLAACVEVLPAVEIVDSRLEEPTKAPAPWKLADNQINGALIIGKPVADWRSLTLDAVEATLIVNGKTLAEGPTKTPGAAPFELLVEFMETVGTLCGGPRKGQVVSTGSLTGLRFIRPGSFIEGDVAGLGALTVDIAGRGE